jgi:hypothetical protein
MVFSTYPVPGVWGTVNATATTQQYFLSTLMRSAWARFAKDPIAGPGWNAIGSGKNYYEREADKDVAVIFEDGVRIKRQGDVDRRCHEVWSGVYRAQM